MHPGQIHLGHFKHNYRFILFKAGLGSWRWKRQQSFLIHIERSQTDIRQCINAGVSWAYKFTVLTQFIVLKKICSRINYNILVLKYLDEFKHLIWLTVWQIPAGTAGIEEMGTARHGDWWSATAAPWDWEWGKTQTLPALSRLAVALQLLIVYQCNPQTHKFIYFYDLHILLFQDRYIGNLEKSSYCQQKLWNSILLCV